MLVLEVVLELRVFTVLFPGLTVDTVPLRLSFLLNPLVSVGFNETSFFVDLRKGFFFVERYDMHRQIIGMLHGEYWPEGKILEHVSSESLHVHGIEELIVYLYIVDSRVIYGVRLYELHHRVAYLFSFIALRSVFDVQKFHGRIYDAFRP